MAASGTLVIRFIGDLKEFERSTGSLARKLNTTGAAMTKGLTVPIVGAGVAAAKTAMDFEKSMSLIQGLVGASEKQIARYSKVILKEGPKWGKAPQDLAEALYFVTSSGFQGAKALDILEKSAKASSAGLGEAMTVADLLTSAMNAYRKSGLKAAEATDILAKAVELGKLEPEEFAGVMGQVLPVASSMGVKFHEVSAALASMSMSGTSASEGTTQLRGILSALLKPTLKAEKQLSEMGLTAQGLRDKIAKDGLLSTLNLLKREFGGNEAATAAVFGNVRALTGVMNMMGENVGSTRKIFGEMESATGSLDKAFEAAQQTAQFKLDAAMAQIKATLIVIGSDILPHVATGLEHLSGWLAKAADGWESMSPAARKVALTIAAVVAAIGPALMVLGKVALVVSKLVPHIRLVTLGVAALIAVFGAARNKTSSFGEAIGKIAGFFTNPKFVAAVDRVKTAVSSFVADIMPTLREVGGQVMDALVPAFRQVADLVRDTLIPAFVRILPIVAPVVKFIIRLIGSALVGAIKGAIQFITGIVDVIAGVFNLIKAIVTGQWGDAWAAVKQIAKGAFNAIVGAIKVWFNLGILALFRQGVKAILKSWKGLLTGLKNLAKKGWAALGKLFTRATGAVSKVISGAVRGYIRFWVNLFKSLVSSARGGWRGITGFFRGALGTIRKMVGTAVGWLVRAFLNGMSRLKDAILSPWRKFIKPAFQALADLVRTTVPKAFRAGVDAIGRVWGKLKNLAAAPVRFIVNTVYMDGIRRVVNAIPGVGDLPAVKFASGGGVFGGQRGRDSVNALLMPGEHVWTAKEVEAAGGHKVILALRKAVLEGGLGRSFDPPRAFAKGGGIDAMQVQRAQAFAASQRGKPYIWGGVGPGGYDCSGFMSAITNVLRGMNPHSRVGSTGTFPWPGFQPGWGQFTIGSFRGSPGHMAGTLGGVNVESSGGVGVRYGGSARGAGDSMFNTIAHLGAGGKGAAMAGGFFDAVGAIKSFLGKAGGWFSELASMGGWGGLMRDMAKHVVGQVKDYVFDKIPGLGGMLKLFDTGGVLASGGLAYNGSGRPERVLDPVTTANFAALTAALNSIMRGGAAPAVAARAWVASHDVAGHSCPTCGGRGGHGGGGGPMTLTGKLELVNGEAYIKGIAEYVVDDALDMADTTGRMGGDDR